MSSLSIALASNVTFAYHLHASTLAVNTLYYINYLPSWGITVVPPHWSSSLMSRTRSIDFWADVKACLAKLDRWDALNQLILLIRQDSKQTPSSGFVTRMLERIQRQQKNTFMFSIFPFFTQIWNQRRPGGNDLHCQKTVCPLQALMTASYQTAS